MKLKLNIKTRFAIFLGIIIVAFATIISLFLWSSNKIQQFNDYHLEVNKLEVEYLTMRRFEQHFLSRYTEDEGFYKSGNNRYLRKHKETFNRLKNNLESLKSNALSKEFGLNQNLEKIIEYNENYERIFRELTQKIYERGSVKTGIIGKIYEDIDIVEQRMKNNASKDIIVNLIQSFKDYLITKDPQYSASFELMFSSLSYRLGSGIDTETMGSETEKSIEQNTGSTLVAALNELKYNFGKLIKLDETIGLNSNEGLQNELRTEIHKFDPEIETLVKTLSIQKEASLKKSAELLAILVGILLLIIIFYIIRFSSSITKPLDSLSKYIQPLSKGILPDKLLVLKHENELHDMTQALNELIVGLKKTTDFAKSIGDGRYDMEFEPLSSQDVLGNSLLSMRENLVKAQKEEKKRQYEDNLRKWSNEGLAQFNELLRQGAGDIDKLTGDIVRHLVNFLDANQSGLFLLNDNNKEDIYLELVATYAYNRERKKQKKIYLGEGLVGMCAVEKSTVYLNDIPEGYLSITSGLGGSTPKSLLIVPLKLEDEIFGVIEIASFNRFEKHEIEFVERVSESISSTISLAKINTRTALLLEKSQRQAEEMAAQEEEMRQNFEELQATQEESARREAEMSSILNAINNSSLVIEFDLNGYIINANEAFLKLLKLKRSEMVGKHQSDFEKMDDDHIRGEEFWNRLKAGEIITDVKSFVIDGETIWLHQVYTPIVDADGEVYKILNLATNITESKKLEQELIEKAELMALQEEELRKNLKDLEAAQNEMAEKQEELRKAHEKAMENEKTLKEVVEKAKKQEHQLRARNAELVEREIELKKQLENLNTERKKLSIELKDLEEENKKLAANEKILKKFIKEAKDNQKNIEEELEKARKEIEKLKGKK